MAEDTAMAIIMAMVMAMVMVMALNHILLITLTQQIWIKKVSLNDFLNSYLRKKNKSLQELEITIKNKKNVISEDAFNKEVISFKKKVQEFKVEKNKIVKNFNNFKRKELENIFKKISPIINDYMEENSISVLLDSKNIFMGSKKSNLTKDILDRINKELK